MLLEQKNTTLAYRCPNCGMTVKSMVGAFSLSGAMFNLKCPCGKSNAIIEKTSDGKFRLTIPCAVCNVNHSFVLSKNVFFNSDVFIIPCSISGIDICFIGKEQNVNDAIEHSDEELSKLLDGVSLSDIKNEDESEYQLDSEVVSMINFVFKDLEEEGKISCYCGNKGEYECEIHGDHVHIRCTKCGAEKTINASSSLDLNDFLDSDSIELK